MAADFEVGDVVVLRSGSLSMTVKGLTPKGVHCVWFDERNELQQAILPAEALRDAGQMESVDTE